MRRLAARRARRREPPRSASGSGTPPASRGDRDVDHALAGERRLRGVAHPRRTRQDDVAGSTISSAYSSALLPGATTIWSGSVGSPRRSK